jgi:hypothetical protein
VHLREIWTALTKPATAKRRFFTSSQVLGLPWFGDAVDPRMPKDRQEQAEESLASTRARMPRKRRD